MALSARKKKALDGYLAGKTKVQAMLDAGYATTTANTKHSDIFGHPDMVREIQRRQKIASTRSDVTLEWITAQLKSIASANLGDIVEIHEDGSASFNMTKMTPDLQKALSSFQSEEYTEGRGPNAKKVKRMKVGLSDKLRALELLVRHLGLSKEKVVVEVEGDLVERLHRGRKIVAGLEDA